MTMTIDAGICFEMFVLEKRLNNIFVVLRKQNIYNSSCSSEIVETHAFPLPSVSLLTCLQGIRLVSCTHTDTLQITFSMIDIFNQCLVNPDVECTNRAESLSCPAHKTHTVFQRVTEFIIMREV